MKHGRRDYNRIQDPAAEPAIYQLIGAIADACGPSDAASEEQRLASLGRAVMTALVERRITLRLLVEFAARATPGVGMRPIGVDEPVFLIRGRDRAAVRTIRHYAEIADTLGARAVSQGAHKIAEEIAVWQKSGNGAQAPTLPGDPEAEEV
jgi:hypothetical protein